MLVVDCSCGCTCLRRIIIIIIITTSVVVRRLRRLVRILFSVVGSCCRVCCWLSVLCQNFGVTPGIDHESC
jgi:hypothetical protein